MEPENEYIKGMVPFEVWTILGEDNSKYLVAEVNKDFLGKISVNPMDIEEDLICTTDQSINTSELVAHAEKYLTFQELILEKYCARTRIKAKEENPKLTVQGLQDLVVDSEEYTRLTHEVMRAEHVVGRTKGLNHAVSRVKVEMLKHLSYNKA